jgi:hypothetical protein
MYMKRHILAALQEELSAWEELLAGMGEAQITAPQPPSMSVKDTIAHLRAWQQRSVVRMEAALHSREPAFPTWAAGLDPEEEGNTDQINAWIADSYRDQPWPDVLQGWKAGFLRLIELGEAISEKDLLDSEKYPWMGGHPLAFVLVATYDHHQEHLEKLRASR